MSRAGHDADFERVLNRLNSANAAEFDDDVPPRTDLYSLQITGLPRSGTTVLYQLLARSRRLGYPSNVMAFFWRTPWIGARLQRQLSAGGGAVSVRSEAGRTPEPLDPHEFGYFWRHALGHDTNSLDPVRSPLEASDLRRRLDLVTSAFDLPVVYKNFLVPAHLDYLRHDVGRQRFIVIARPVHEVAASLWQVRQQLNIAANEPFGPQPTEICPTYNSVEARIAHQVSSLDRTWRESAWDGDTLFVEYEDLCRSPREIVQQCSDHALAQLGDPEMGDIPAHLEPARSWNRLPRDVQRRLERAMVQATG